MIQVQPSLHAHASLRLIYFGDLGFRVSKGNVVCGAQVSQIWDPKQSCVLVQVIAIQRAQSQRG